MSRGSGAGLTFPAVSGAAVMSVPGERFALASALNAVSRQVGAALGVAALVAILGGAARRRARSPPSGTPGPSPALCLLAGGAMCLPLSLRASAARRATPEPAEPAGAVAGGSKQ